MTSTPSHRVLFLVAGTREGGNTETLARAAAASLPPQAEQRWLRLSELPGAPFVDIRHSVGVYPAPEGHAATLAEATLWASDLVIVSPVYWYNLSASAKAYLDLWSGWLRVPGMDFKARMGGRRLWAVTVTSDDEARDAAVAGPLVQSLQLTAEYMGMAWAGALVGHGNRPGDIAADSGALARAGHFFAGLH